MREKLANLSISTKIILILLIITVIMAGTLGIAFATHTDFKKLIKSEETAKAISIPNVTKENTEIEISNAEENEGSVIITAKSKLENYKLYYYIEPIKSEEDLLLEQSQNIENLKPEGKIEDKNYTVYENNIEIFSNAKVYLKYESQGKYSDNAYIIELNNITELIGNEALENEMATEEELEEARVKEKDTPAPSESTQPTQSVEPSQTTTPSQSPEPTTDPNPTQTTNPDPTQSTEPSQTTTPSQSPDPTTDPNPSETPSPTTPVNPGEGDSEGNLENE